LSQLFDDKLYLNLQKSFILIIILLFFNNQMFKDIILNYSIFINENGDVNIFGTLFTCFIISFCYVIYLQIST
jgi:hypothetical protein